MNSNVLTLFCLAMIFPIDAFAVGELPLTAVSDRPIPVDLASILSADRKEIKVKTGMLSDFSIVGFQKIEAFPFNKAKGWFLVAKDLHDEGTFWGFAIDQSGNVVSSAAEVTSESCLVQIDEKRLAKLQVGKQSFRRGEPISSYLILTLFSTALGPLDSERLIFSCGTLKLISRDTDDYKGIYQVVYLSDFAHNGSIQIMVHSFDFSNSVVIQDWCFYTYDTSLLDYEITSLPLDINKVYKQECEHGKSSIRVELLPPNDLAPGLARYRTSF